MSRRGEKNLLIGLDIGTNKIAALVGEVKDDGQIEIIGIGTHPSRGLKKGSWWYIESTVQSIQRAVEEAELMAGCEIHSVHAGIAGSHIRSLNSHGITAIKEREVTQADVDRVIDAARAVAIPRIRRSSTSCPRNSSSTIRRDPRAGRDVRRAPGGPVHMVTGAVSAAQNIVKCVRRCGLEVDDSGAGAARSSYAVLREDEKELGVCLVDIGGGTTDIAVFTDGAIRHTAVIPIAGDQVTNDIAVALRTPTQIRGADQDQLRLRPDSARRQRRDHRGPQHRRAPGAALSRQTLAEVVEPRYEELLTLLQTELRRSGFEDLVAGGVVMTGGSSKMEGLIELAEEVFHMPVRLGVPQHVTGLEEVTSNPIYATGVGLLMYAQQHRFARARSCPRSRG